MREPTINAEDTGEEIPFSCAKTSDLRLIAADQWVDDDEWARSSDGGDEDFEIRYATILLRERGL